MITVKEGVLGYVDLWPELLKGIVKFHTKDKGGVFFFFFFLLSVDAHLISFCIPRHTNCKFYILWLPKPVWLYSVKVFALVVEMKAHFFCR